MSDDPQGPRRPWLRVVTEDVTLPDGRHIDLDVIHHPGAAAIVPFLDDDTVLLIRQYRHCAGGIIWEVPAGTMDPGEDPATTAARELEEEAGQRPGHLEHLASIWTTPGFTDEVIHLYAATQLTEVPQALEEDEVIELCPTSLRDALELVWSGELNDAKSSLALLHAARWRGALQTS